MGGAAKSGTTARAHLTTLATLAGMLILLFACYGLIGLIAEDEDDTSGQSQSFLGIAEEDVVGISWSYGDTTCEMALEDGIWTYPADPEAELNQTKASSIASAVAGAETVRTLDAQSKTEDMGLDEASITVEVTLADGGALSFSLGDAAPDSTSVYAQRGDSDAVYLVDDGLLSTLSCDMGQIYKTEDAPASSTVNSLSIEHDGAAIDLVHHESGSDASYSDEYEWFADKGDGQTAIATSAATVVVAAVNDVSWTSCVDPTYDGEDDYGFDDPTLTATLAYTTDERVQTGETDEDGNAVYETNETEHMFILVVGDKAKDGTGYYAQPQGSTRVYTISQDDVDTLLEASIESMLPDDVIAMDWDTVDAMEITCDGAVKTVEFVREGGEDEGDDASNDEEGQDGEASYRVDGNDADAQAVEDFLDALDSLSSEGEGSADEAAEEEGFEIRIDFTRNTETFSQMTFGLTRYDNSFYLVSFDGRERLLVSKNDVATLKSLFEAL